MHHESERLHHSTATMLRSPTNDREDFSSPDPLATSLNDHYEFEAITSPSRRKSRPATSRQSCSAGGHMSTLISAYENEREAEPEYSPIRTITEHNLSPWKIRVTLEAEPEERDMASPRTMAHTIKVPLRQHSYSEGSEMTIDRGRQPQTRTAKSKRKVTPSRARGGGRNRRPSVTDLNLTVLGDDADSDDWTKTKRSASRKRKTSKSRRKTACQDADQSTTPATSRSRRAKSSAISEFEIRQDAGAGENDAVDDQPHVELDSPELRTIDLNTVAVRSRALSAKQKDDGIMSEMASKDSPAAENAIAPQSQARMVSENSAFSYPTPSPTSSYHGNSDDRGQVPDSTEVHEAFDSILESEGFTMIDVESIPSAKQYFSSPADVQRCKDTLAVPKVPSVTESQVASNNDSQQHKPTAILSYLMLAEGESDISSNVPSSPPADTQRLSAPTSLSTTRKVTPQPYSSPKLPSPPKQTRPSPETGGLSTAICTEVLSAGKTLQSVLSPDPSRISTKSNHPQDLVTPHGLEGHLFDGFDSGTKRELRAGLRFGEELAKRQQPHLEVTDPGPAAAGVTFRKPRDTSPPDRNLQRQRQVWRGETVVQHSPLAQNHMPDIQGLQHLDSTVPAIPTQARTRNGLSPAQQRQTSVQTPPHSSSKEVDQSFLDTTARREREWQCEREAVSKQIQNASESQVIVIDSDDDDDEGNETSNLAMNHAESLLHEDEEDVWLAEAQSSSSPETGDKSHELFSRTEERKQHREVKQALSQPRSVLPSPWKREDVTEASTLLTNGDLSGIFWQEPQAQVKFGAGHIARQKRQLSGAFDVDRMVGTPRARVVSQTDSLHLNSSVIDETTDDDELEPESHQADLSQRLDTVHKTSIHDESGHERSDETPPAKSEDDDETSELSRTETVKIPVNFNDSSLSTDDLRPSLASPNLRSASQSPPRPSTPRSAMKGGRLNFDFERAGTPPAARKVVFSERSMCVDVEGVESSISAKDVSSSISDPELPQPTEDVQEQGKTAPDPSDPGEGEKGESKRSGWLGWIWNRKGSSSVESTSSSAVPPHANAIEIPNVTVSDNDAHDDDWKPAKSPIPSSSRITASISNLPVVSPAMKPKETFRSKRQPYLLPPSYPSDPTRDARIPLSTGPGPFTTTHFRTLHIIQAKASRTRFHAPKHIRASIRDLIDTKFEVDESKAGLGVFEWEFGWREAEVLERFMQEIEFGYCRIEDEDGDRTGEDDHLEVSWGWSERQLAEWLCRIVVGEVVREEEKKLKLKRTQHPGGRVET